MILLTDESAVAVSRMQIAVGKQDHLLRQIIYNENSEGGNQITETYSETNLRPVITGATFTYKPAVGAVAAEAPKDPPMYDPRLKVGALPLPITGKDLSGKAVTLDSFKGKVLLLDFWATWCGPCMEEMPHVIAVYARYHDAGFEVVGISLDDRNVLPKLEQFLQDHKMPWQQICDGKGWKADNAVAYGVQAIPFTLLIGRDGKIVAVDLAGPDLAPAIASALVKPQHASVQ